MRNAHQENYLCTAIFLKSGHGILIDKIDHSFYSKETEFIGPFYCPNQMLTVIKIIQLTVK